MKLILSQNVPSLGMIGDLVKVRDGYARNYLVPRGLGVVANEKNKSAFDHQRRILEKKKKAILDEAKQLAASVEKVSVTVAKQVGEGEKIFGSVTTAELETLLANEGLKINRRDIKLSEDIKKVGVYAAEVKLHPEVTAKFKVWVVAQ